MLRSALARQSLVTAAMATALVLTGCTTTTTAQVAEIRQVVDGRQVIIVTRAVTANPQEALAFINAVRAEAGLRPVTLDRDLMERAEYQAQAMAAAGVMSHSVSGSFEHRMRGRTNAPAAENIAAGYTSLQGALESWVHSQSHYRNLLLRSATTIGIAVAYNPSSVYGNFYALILAGPSH